ncbi:hypothetical protein P389DRAFT_56157 [Cystobasidium minutum MCA 4210]|uniref:uncharacterized protein n=1 Tax=Cystobasidium minutum MCA 4210 TaxID=1397322 RepID=UPI0034CFBF01|eukprot:jgi/Rhomi1/56157/CE56156_55
MASTSGNPRQSQARHPEPNPFRTESEMEGYVAFLNIHKTEVCAIRRLAEVCSFLSKEERDKQPDPQPDSPPNQTAVVNCLKEVFNCTRKAPHIYGMHQLVNETETSRTSTKNKKRLAKVLINFRNYAASREPHDTAPLPADLAKMKATFMRFCSELLLYLMHHYERVHFLCRGPEKLLDDIRKRQIDPKYPHAARRSLDDSIAVACRRKLRDFGPIRHDLNASLKWLSKLTNLARL